jgi:hypothetical protein
VKDSKIKPFQKAAGRETAEYQNKRNLPAPDYKP